MNVKTVSVVLVIGNKVGIATLGGHSISGILAWMIWRAYYLSQVPTFDKKLKIFFDWVTDSILTRDVTLVGTIKKKEINSIHINENVPSIKEQLLADL